jgi:hypothetical protein
VDADRAALDLSNVGCFQHGVPRGSSSQTTIEIDQESARPTALNTGSIGVAMDVLAAE